MTAKPLKPASSRSASTCGGVISPSPGSPHFWIWNFATSWPTSLSNRPESLRFRPRTSLTLFNAWTSQQTESQNEPSTNSTVLITLSTGRGRSRTGFSSLP